MIENLYVVQYMWYSSLCQVFYIADLRDKRLNGFGSLSLRHIEAITAIFPSINNFFNDTSRSTYVPILEKSLPLSNNSRFGIKKSI